MKNIDFFLGANSSEGFASLFSELYSEESENVVILKGGPGTGKSTLMKKIAAKAKEEGDAYVENIHCSSDPSSLDAVIFNNGKNCVIDGTSPHTVDPIWPGAIETLVNLGDCWNRSILKENKAKIIEIVKRKKRLYGQAYKLIKIAGNSRNAVYRSVSEAVIGDKVTSLVEKISEMFPKYDKRGKKTLRLLSGITPDGVITYTNTVSSLCDNIIVLEDDYGISGEILKRIAENAIEKGIDTIYCMQPLFPFERIEHIILPQIKLAVVTDSFNADFSAESLHVISLNNFMKTSEVSLGKARMAFEKKAEKEIIAEACKKLSEARELHTLIEQIYVLAMDFSAIDEKTKNVLEIFNFAIDK